MIYIDTPTKTIQIPGEPDYIWDTVKYIDIDSIGVRVKFDTRVIKLIFADTMINGNPLTSQLVLNNIPNHTDSDNEMNIITAINFLHSFRILGISG